jgi:TatA/E family protein of Tat protein translocase
MFDVGGAELIVIVLAIIMLFGPKSIPKFMQQIGRGVRQFRKAQEDLTQQIRDISADAAIQDALSMDTPPAPITVRPADGVSRNPVSPVVTATDDTAPSDVASDPSTLPDASDTSTDSAPAAPSPPTAP